MKSRKPVELGERINKRWLGYAAAAGAAGNKQWRGYADAGTADGFDAKALIARALPAGAITLGLLGGGDLAWADSIVYTPANIRIPLSCLLVSGCGSYGRYRGSLAIDLNHDGVNDFQFISSARVSLEAADRTLQAIGLGANGVAKGAQGAAALPKGA
jgi:hypothetical protein